MENEKHPFIELPDYEVKHILLGSFSCLKNGSYGEWFYLGSGRSNFWRLIEQVYDTKLPTTADKKQLMRDKKIWITDVAAEIYRTKEEHGCLDNNLKIVKYNTEMIQEVLDKNQVTNVLCTSAWVTDLYLKKVVPQLKATANMPEAVKLPSPSPMADQAIRANAEFKELAANNIDFTPLSYRLLKFRAAFPQ